MAFFRIIAVQHDRCGDLSLRIRSIHDEGFLGMLTPRRSQNEAQQVHPRENRRYSQGALGRNEGCRSDPEIRCLRAVHLPLPGQIWRYDRLRSQTFQVARRGEPAAETDGGGPFPGQADARVYWSTQTGHFF